MRLQDISFNASSYQIAGAGIFAGKTKRWKDSEKKLPDVIAVISKKRRKMITMPLKTTTTVSASARNEVQTSMTSFIQSVMRRIRQPGL